MEHMHPNVKINLEFVPFGQIRLRMRAGKEPEPKQEFPTYEESISTNIDMVEILFDGLEYRSPISTGGSW